MTELKASDPIALHFLMTEDLFKLDEQSAEPDNEPVPTSPVPGDGTGILVEVPEERPEFDYAGENNRYMLLLHRSPGHTQLPAVELDALRSILGAKKMDLKDVALVNLAAYPSASFDQLKEFFDCSSIVLFGIPPKTLKMEDIQMNHISSHQGVKVLFTYSFAEMLASNDKKRAFWSEMKNL